MASIVDFYDLPNKDYLVHLYASQFEVGQSFKTGTSNAWKLTKASFLVQKLGSPSGSVVARIWSHTGTYGSTGYSDTLLATSDAVSTSTFTTGDAAYDFNFSGANAIKLERNTAYFVMLYYAGGDASNMLKVGADASSPAHSGNVFIKQPAGSEFYTTNYDLTFAVFGERLPLPSISATPTSGNAPLAVAFTGSATNSPTSWAWDFGDGTTSTAQSPSKTYSAAGTYPVSLTASNAYGSDTLTKTSYITVLSSVLSRDAKGTVVLGGGATGKATYKRTASGTITIGGQAYGVIRSDIDAIETKKYLVKVYDEDGNYLETWRDVMSEPSYSQETNQIGSAMTLELARNSDSLGQVTAPLLTEAGTTITTESGVALYATTSTRNQVGDGSTVQHNNRVDVYVYYGEVSPLLTEAGEEITTENGELLLAQTGAPSGKRIFTGFIAEINTRYGENETTIVQLLSYGFDLNQFILDDTSGNTTLTYNSQDPSQIVKDVMDRFATVSASYGTYTRRATTSIATTGTTVSYTFRINTYGEVLEKALELMPSDWYFYVGLGDNIVYFKQRTTTPQHTFYLGKHLEKLEVRSYIGESYNDVAFVGGGDPQLYKRYTEAPAERTRRTLHRFSDSRVTLESSAQILSQGLIDQKNRVQYRSTITVLSGQYDIETITVGDMVGFRNFGNFKDDLMLQVVGLTYTPDYVTLQLDSLPRTVNKRVEDLRRNMIMNENQNVPTAPV